VGELFLDRLNNSLKFYQRPWLASMLSHSLGKQPLREREHAKDIVFVLIKTIIPPLPFFSGSSLPCCHSFNKIVGMKILKHEWKKGKTKQKEGYGN